MFAALVFLTGGGSRFDIESVGPLRAVSALVLALALFFQTDKSMRRIAAPLFMMIGLAAWMALQLIPLPAGLWSSLPGREAIYDAGVLVGLEDIWRPITFSPLKTANSLASLVVPITALLILALLDDKGWRRLPWVFIGAGVASALFGIAQIMLSGSTGLYLYEITNEGSAVGLFSNRNHNAIFLTIALLFCVVRMERIRIVEWSVADLAAVICSLIIFAGILVNASRTGLAGLGVVGLIFAIRTIMHWRRSAQAGNASPARMLIGMAVGLLSTALVAVFALLGRSPAVERLLQHDAAGDQRIQSLPVVLDMVRGFQPFGVGLGAFEQAFYTVETTELLRPRYLNHAHNDWLQFPIEGGVPAILILIVAIVLIVLQVRKIARASDANNGLVSNAWLGTLTLGIFAVASIVDYPLRTPSLMVLAAAALAMMFKPMAQAGK